MPRRRKFAKVTKFRRYKTRTYKRRFTRRRRVAGRRTRRRKYHISKKKRSLSKTYGLRKYAGIKWTRYLSLAEFLNDDKWDLMWLYCLWDRSNGHLYTKDGNQVEAAEDLIQYSLQIARATYGVFSTDLWSNKTYQVPKYFQQFVYWKAYSPFPHTHNLGPLFNLYLTQYKKMKYVGMKVKWIPGIQKTTTFAPSFSTTTKVQDLTTPVLPYQLAATASGGTAFSLYPNTDLTISSTIPSSISFGNADPNNVHIQFPPDTTGLNLKNVLYTGLVKPPALRLWVNFDKQGYEGMEFKTNCVKNVALVNDNVNFRNSRIRLARVFNADGFKTSISDKLVKSYSLMKPFKFFVRPKMALKFQENIENENVASNAETTMTDMDQKIETSAAEGDSYLSTGKKMPYLSVMSTWPSGTLTGAGWDSSSVSSTAVQILRTLKSDGYFDPILFGWGLSCDDLELNEQLDYFRFMHRAPTVPTDMFNHCYEFIGDPECYKGYGKFKVTYYCRFKEFNPLQNVIIPDKPKFQNAMLSEEIAQLPTN